MSRLENAQTRLEAAFARLEAALKKAPPANGNADLAAALEAAQRERVALREKADTVALRLDTTIDRLRSILNERAG